MVELNYLAQIVLAMFLGGIIGWQRNRWGKSAGMRTYALVAAGSALFTLLSIVAFGVAGDNSRLAAGVVTGIGFLGAGLIMHRGHHVEGLTTAAGLWATAAMGMAVAAGYYILSLGMSVVIFLVLMVDDKDAQK